MITAIIIFVATLALLLASYAVKTIISKISMSFKKNTQLVKSGMQMVQQQSNEVRI